MNIHRLRLELFHPICFKVAGVLLIGLALSPPQAMPLAAHGSGSIILEQETESYRVSLRGSPPQPSIGLWHLSVFVLDRVSSQPITSFNARLLSTPPLLEAEPTPRNEVFEGTPCPEGEGCQDINAELRTFGDWRMTLVIDSSLGKEETQFVITVREASVDISSYTINGLLIILVILITITTRSWWLPRGRSIMRIKNRQPR